MKSKREKQARETALEAISLTICEVKNDVECGRGGTNKDNAKAIRDLAEAYKLIRGGKR